MLHSTSSRNQVALSAVCLSALMFGLEISSVPTILPTLEQLSSADFRQLQWVMNAYTTAMTACLMAMGALADRFGRKRVFLAGQVVFGVASLACGLADSPSMLIGARALQGAAAAALLTCQIAVLSHQFRDGRERALAFGWWGVTFGVGLGFGPLIGGLTAVVLGWEWVFLVHVILAAVAVILIQVGVEESTDPHALRLDVAGMVTLSLAVFCLVYLITRGRMPGPGDISGLALAALGVACFSAFVVVETRVARPMFDFTAFRTTNFSGALLASAGMNFSFWPFIIYLPVYFQGVLGLDSLDAGLCLLAYTLPPLLAPPIAERLLLHFGPQVVIPLGLVIIGCGFVLMRAAALGGDASWVDMLPGCILAGSGLGLANTTATNTASAALPPERAGMASGMNMSASMIALAINIALMGFILLQGTQAGLERLLPAATGDELSLLAESVAAGGEAAAAGAGLPIALVRQSLVHGFDWVMLYGAGGVWLFAAICKLVFGSAKRSGPAPCDR
ncbi:MFS transporter [Rhodospirillum rubrum]|uniref:MFS transporter n=1 Tax=Rhodospirillum rubrum TaxID=1085 RepID=UPI00190442B8|nr:MFS transporter [Rhodospirillum rubrum]MBK1664486.1 MFS transporter [Rhodospirillum rubrum]MBK1676257.1 MFS transporter [Rhodospirillum rubrum]